MTASRERGETGKVRRAGGSADSMLLGSRRDRVTAGPEGERHPGRQAGWHAGRVACRQVIRQEAIDRGRPATERLG